MDPGHEDRRGPFLGLLERLLFLGVPLKGSIRVPLRTLGDVWDLRGFLGFWGVWGFRGFSGLGFRGSALGTWSCHSGFAKGLCTRLLKGFLQRFIFKYSQGQIPCPRSKARP